MFGDIGENRSVIFGENVSATRRNHSAILEKPFGDLERIVWQYWRGSFGDNVGDLEKRVWRSYGDFALEFAME